MNPLLIPFILVLVLFLLSAAGLAYFAFLKKDEPAATRVTATPSSPPAASPSASPSAQNEQAGKAVPDLNNLAVGDCGNLPGIESGENVEAFLVPCGQSHQFEVFARGKDAAGPDAAYPGDTSIKEANAAFCTDQFNEYTGANKANANRDKLKGIDKAVVPPDEDNWARGDRTIVCAANLPGGAPFTGSIKDRAVT